ncbi:MAG: recombinase, partial [Hyphomicrobiales bacterium]|nr:recombinase [Hyphomicrobiales bacterium]
MQRTVNKIEAQIEQFLDRIVSASSSSVIAADEKRISDLEQEKLLSNEKLAFGAQPQRSFEDSFELAMAFLSNPWKIWTSER